jgi:hypothetical protein
MKKKITDEMKELLRAAGSFDFEIAKTAQRELAKALTLPLKRGVLKGDNIGGIFEEIEFEPGAATEFPLDFVAPGTEKDYSAFAIPNTGRIPERSVEGDYLMVPTFSVGAAIDWPLKYARQARWDVVGRALQVLEAMFVRKSNDDGWRTILAAAVFRNIVIHDASAVSGLFTKRLISLLRTQMRRASGGNRTSLSRGRVTDVYMSPEGIEDIRSWDATQVDEMTRREIFLADDENGVSKVFNVFLHDVDEFGVGQEYQHYFTNLLGGTMPGDKQEILVALDRENNDSFVNPVRQKLEIYEDMMFHRQQRAGMYGWAEHGYGVLDNRRVLLGAF